MLEFFGWLEQTRLSLWVRESGTIWSFPTILLLHTLGMSIVAGGNAMLDLVLLGFWPGKTPIKPLEKYFPLIWAGFWLNAVTGTSAADGGCDHQAYQPGLWREDGFHFCGRGGSIHDAEESIRRSRAG